LCLGAFVAILSGLSGLGKSRLNLRTGIIEKSLLFGKDDNWLCFVNDFFTDTKSLTGPFHREIKY